MQEVPDGHESKKGITPFQSSKSLPGLNSPRAGKPRSPRQLFPRVPLAARSVWREPGAEAHILTRRPYKNGVGSTPMWPNWEPGVTSLRLCRAPSRTQRMLPEERQGKMAGRSLRPELTSRLRAGPGKPAGSEAAVPASLPLFLGMAAKTGWQRAGPCSGWRRQRR